MPTICTPDVIPTYSGIVGMFSGVEVCSLPSMPTMPTPLYENFNNVPMNVHRIVMDMMQNQMLIVQLKVLEVLTEYLEIDLATILPPMLGFPSFNILDLIQGKANEMIAVIAADPAAMLTVFGLPNPLYPNFHATVVEAKAILDAAISAYTTLLVTTITGLITQVTDLLAVTAMAIPTIPTRAQLMALLPSTPTIEDVIALAPPPFGAILSLPSPLFASLSIPALEIEEAMQAMQAALVSASLQTIQDFIDTLPLTLELPTFCIVLPSCP